MEKPLNQQGEEERKRETIKQIIDYPHRLGIILGFTKLTELHSHWIKFLWYPASYFKSNQNWKKTVNYFNKLGNCFEIQTTEGQTEFTKLTKESFFELLENRFRVLQAARGTFKSSAIVVTGIIARFLIDINVRIGIIRKDFTKASGILKTVSNMMAKDKVKDLFLWLYKINIKPVKNSDARLSYNFKLTISPEGNLNAYGIHSSTTGEHWDIAIFDDFVTHEDKLSRAEREKTKARVEENKNFVLDPGKPGIFLGTPWHKEDAFSTLPPALKFDIFMCKIHSKKEIEEKRKNTTPTTFASQCLLKHIANENTLLYGLNANFERWNIRANAPIAVLDKKFSGKDTNCLVFCAKKENGRFQVIGWVFREHIKYKIKFIHDKWLYYKIGTLWTELNDDKGGTADQLSNEGILVDTFYEKMNKHNKIVTHVLNNGFYELIDFDPDCDEEFLTQLTDYAEGVEPDDAIDALADMGRIMIGQKQNAHTRRWHNMN